MKKLNRYHSEAFRPRRLHHSIGSPCERRVIKTGRTVDEIDSAARSGLKPLLKPVVAGPEIQSVVAVFQDATTGEIDLATDVRFGAHGTKVLDYMDYYPYQFPNPFAAYLVPADIAVGEEVWLEDLIEDRVAVWGNQGYRPRLDAAAAFWNGTDFEIAFDSERDADVWIG